MHHAILARVWVRGDRDIGERFLACGDYRLGVARIRCTNTRIAATTILDRSAAKASPCVHHAVRSGRCCSQSTSQTKFCWIFRIVPISITSTVDSLYQDGLSDDGLLIYRYRGSDPLHRDNIIPPKSKSLWPDHHRLEQRYARFLEASSGAVVRAGIPRSAEHADLVHVRRYLHWSGGAAVVQAL